MTDELFDEVALRRALRLDPEERVRLDARALAAAAAAAEQARLARVALLGLVALAAVPVFGFLRVAALVVADPAVLTQPLALAALVAVPLAEGLVLLADPAIALAFATAVAIVTVFEGRERVHARAS